MNEALFLNNAFSIFAYPITKDNCFCIPTLKENLPNLNCLISYLKADNLNLIITPYQLDDSEKWGVKLFINFSPYLDGLFPIGIASFKKFDDLIAFTRDFSIENMSEFKIRNYDLSKFCNQLAKSFPEYFESPTIAYA